MKQNHEHQKLNRRGRIRFLCVLFREKRLFLRAAESMRVARLRKSREKRVIRGLSSSGAYHALKTQKKGIFNITNGNIYL
jgi:hypothetical protein